MTINATIAICTWNRAKLLDKTLARLNDLQIPAGSTWEVVVVNNRSTDETDAIIENHAARLPLRRVLEERQGLSHARNAAVAAARGELILWTDDDVLVDCQWLAETVAAASHHPDCSFFGGPIEPWFEVEPPAWLLRNWRQFNSAYAIRDFGPDPLAFDESQLPFGANYAVRREVQRQFAYDARLGRSGTSAIGGEETAVLSQMLAAGYRGRWIPTAKVRHFLPRERLTLEYLRNFYQGVGQTECLQRTARGDLDALSLWTVRKTQLQHAWEQVAWAGLSVLPHAQGKQWARALIRANVARGRLTAWRAA